MSTFKDICFCINKECKKRKKCGRALENYPEAKTWTYYISMAEFKCDDKDSMFIKILK